MLREAERLVPVVDGNDINVPKVKISHEGPPKQGTACEICNSEDLSCIFTCKMIQKYDKLNKEFAQRMRKESLPKDLADAAARPFPCTLYLYQFNEVTK